MRHVLLVLVLGSIIGCFRSANEGDALFEGAFRRGHDAARRGERTRRHPSLGLTRDEVLAEANEKFTYLGKSIHPALVHEFECWLSDQNPVTLAVDVSAAYDTNEYHQPVTTRPLGVTFETTHGQEVLRKEYYSYQRLGVLSDGTHVLRTALYGGGTGVFMSLVFVRLELGSGRYDDGAAYDRLVMRLVRDWCLGDRFPGSIQVLTDRVVVRGPAGLEVTLGPDRNY